MDIIKEIERNVKNDETIYVLVRNPGMNERYINYALKNDKEKLKFLKELKEKEDLIAEFSKELFLRYTADRRKLLHERSRIAKLEDY